MKVTTQGYYSWLKKQSEIADESERFVLARITEIHKQSRGNYGSPRVHEALVAEGLPINHKKVERIMKQNGIRAKRKKKFKATTNSKHNKKISDDLLQRNFAPKSPTMPG